MDSIKQMLSGRNLLDSAIDEDEPTIRSFHCWQVDWDAGASSVAGKVKNIGMSPTKLLMKDRRVIAFEMRRVPPEVVGGKETEQCLVRVMVKAKTMAQAAAGMPGGAVKVAAGLPGNAARAVGGAVGAVTPMRMKSKKASGKIEGMEAVGSATQTDDKVTSADALDDDDASVGTIGADAFLPTHDDLGPGGWKAGRFPNFSITESQGGGSNTIPLATEWKTKHELPMREVDVVSHKGTKIGFTAGGRHTGIKHLRFASEAEATAFLQLFKILKAGQAERDQERKVAAMAGLKVKDPKAPLTLLVEIVSAWDIAKADAVGGSDPYVKVTMNGKEVHKTKHVNGTLEPTYTIKTGSLFLINTTADNLFDCQDGLKFEVKDYDTVGGSESLGHTFVSPRTLYEADGERMVFPLFPEAGRTSVTVKGNIAIRSRHATEHDIEFMAKLKRGMSKISEEDPTALSTDGGRSDLKSMMTMNTKKEKNMSPDGGPAKLKKYKVRPYADPDHKAETKWLTHARIQDEAMKRSKNWIDAGTGGLGRVYLEIIGCDDLPNLDSGGLVGNKTDSYVTVVFEDCVLKTDVIADKLCPRWLPWSKRAFALRVMHSSSQIHLGIFDYDTGYDDHDAIGRVSIDLSSFHPYTEYLLHYNIYNTDVWKDRKARGSITVRLMIEYENERGLLLSALTLPPPSFHVNLPLKKDFHVVRYAATGQMGAKKYGLQQINKYIEELMTYQRTLFYIQDGLKSIILWRGHHPVSICIPRLCPFKDIEELGGKKCTRSVTIKLPIRSLLVFVAAVIVVEHPKYLLSFILASLGLILSSSLAFRRNCPSKWFRCRTYHYHLRTLILGKGISPPQTIVPYENAEEFEEFEKKWEENVKTYEEEAEKARIENLQKQEEYQKEMAAIGDANVDISTQGGGGVMGTGVTIDPFAALWVQIQTIVEQVVTIMRFVRNVVIWEESYIAFWLTTSLYLLAIVCLFVPWGWLILWTSRILVWTFLGPWMMCVDIFWHSYFKQKFQEMKEEGEKAQQEQLDLLRMQARTAREDAKKLKVLKKAMFGPYISNVPTFKTSRYKSIPLLASEAQPISASKLKKEKETWRITRVKGQHLEGVMIPTIEDTVHPEEGGGEGAVGFDGSPLDGEEEGANEVGETKPLVNGKKKPVYTA